MLKLLSSTTHCPPRSSAPQPGFELSLSPAAWGVVWESSDWRQPCSETGWPDPEWENSASWASPELHPRLLRRTASDGENIINVNHHEGKSKQKYRYCIQGQTWAAPLSSSSSRSSIDVAWISAGSMMMLALLAKSSGGHNRKRVTWSMSTEKN